MVRKQLLSLGFVTLLAGCSSPHMEIFASNPLPTTEQNLTAGKALYQQHCLSCHGASGLGDGVDAKTLSEKPADLTKMPSFPAGFIEFAIKNGGDTVDMPAWQGTLSQQQIYLVANYVRSFK